MLNVHNLSILFGGEALFSSISFRLNAGDRVGLVGKNGAGKSTMLKILAKDIEPNSGTLAFEKDVKIGFLRQDIDFEEGRTVLEEAYQAFEEIKYLEKKIAEVNELLVIRTDYESEAYMELIHDLDDYSQQFGLLGGYNYEGDTEKILKGLGFTAADFNKKTETFSGGWRMRIELAKLLLQDNDILLLDEPTNHLDIESIIWFENFLKKTTGAVVVVSHDKMFLDNITNRTIEVVLGKIYDYNKPYSQYLIQRAELIEKQQQAKKNQDDKIKEQEALIEKFRYKASKAAFAQSLIKKLDKVERIQVDEVDTAAMRVSFAMSVQPGKVVVEAEKLYKSYGDKKVLDDINLLIERNSRIAFVGQNGQGKSTLAKVIVGEITDYTGDFKLGHNVQIGYFAQNQAHYLDGEKTVLDTMFDAATDSNRVKVRDMLGAFLFRGDDVEKKVKVLSGGERNRLALCKMMLHPFNVLVMDEPTNHLDIPSKTVLKNALNVFEGTLLVVSHDRDFLQGLTDNVYEFHDHKIKHYLGDINYFLDAKQMENMREVEKVKKAKVAVQKKEKETNQLSYHEQKALDKAQKQLKNRFSKVERLMSEAEQEIKGFDKQVAENFSALDTDFFANYDKKKETLNALEAEWEELYAKIAASDV